MPPEELEKFAGRPFSFYPPIVNIEHNEWIYLKETWAEVLVKNTKSGEELWIPRRYVGEISRVDEPVMIVGLVQELEYKGGSVWPCKRRVVEMPRTARPAAAEAIETGVSRRPRKARGSPAEKRLGRFIIGSLMVAVVAIFVVVAVFHSRQSGGRIKYKTIVQTNLKLTAQDDYFAVVRKLGAPAADRWQPGTGERKYRALSYPKLGVTLILMGADRNSVRYIGAKNKHWKTVQSVTLPGGSTSEAILRSLPPF